MLLGTVPSGLFAQPLDCIHPAILVPSDQSPIPGETVTYTVTFSGAASSAGYMTISSTTLSNFATLPSEASYNTGDTSLVFTGTVANNAAGNLQVSASNAAGAASVTVTIVSGDLFRF